MAYISDFSVQLRDGGINWSTNDPNYQNSTVYINLKQADGSSYSYSDNTTGGVGGSSWNLLGYDTNPPALPLTIEFTINDDNDPNVIGNYDSKFVYNITSATDDIFDNGNVAFNYWFGFYYLNFWCS